MFSKIAPPFIIDEAPKVKHPYNAQCIKVHTVAECTRWGELAEFMDK